MVKKKGVLIVPILHRITAVEGVALLDLPLTGEGEIKILMVFRLLKLLKRLLTGKMGIDTPFSHIDSFTFDTGDNNSFNKGWRTANALIFKAAQW